MIRIAIATVLLSAASVCAASALTLKQPVTAAGDVVRLGDFFADGGEHAEIALFRAPAPGTKGTVNVTRLAKAVRRLGIGWTPPAGIRSVVVTRAPATPPGSVANDTIESALRAALADALPEVAVAEDVSVTLTSRGDAIALREGSAAELAVTRLDVDPRRSRFQATLEVTETNISHVHDFLGTYTIFSEVPVLSANVRRGEVLTPDHVTIVRVREPEADALRNVADIVGMAARRSLREGTTLSASDIEPPKVIGRNELVTLTFAMPGIVLTTQARSLGVAAVGETVSVMNVRSNRIVQAIATGPGQASVISAPTQFAMR